MTNTIDAMDEQAKYLVAKKYNTLEPVIKIYIVWKCKILKNWKYLLSTTLEDNRYYEATYDGDKQCWYLDTYEKIKNEKIE